MVSNFPYSLKTARGPLIETHELYELILKKESLKILQSGQQAINFNNSIYSVMANQKGEPDQIFMEERIPGAQFFDLKEVFDQNTKLLHMLSSAEQFGNYMKSQNLKKSDTFIIYDDFGVIGACRAWWTMKIFGIENVYILNGSSIKWKNEQLPIEITPPKKIIPSDTTETFELNQNLVVNIDYVQKISSYILNGDESFEIVDSRSSGKFDGTELETREGLRSGSIPGSKNLFFKDVVHQDWSFKNNKELKEIFEGKENKRIINSCNSGMTATVIYFAEELLGVKNKAIYDGSWTEYGLTPLEGLK